MAYSKAKKQRMKIEREGRRNPEQNRVRNEGLWTRMTKDKTKYTRKGRRNSDAYQNEPSPYFFILFRD